MVEFETYNTKMYFIKNMISDIRKNGHYECWVLNKQNLEIYSFKSTQISDFDLQIDLFNSLENEKIFSGIFIMHMRENILKLFQEVPGTIFSNKIECYRTFYEKLQMKILKIKNPKKQIELQEKIDFIEMEFPQLLI